VNRDQSNAAQQGKRTNKERRAKVMEMPLFPLNNVVLFPGMVLPLHIFELRYREMINRCLAEQLPFGVLLIKEGAEVGEPAIPHMVGTAARIAKVEHLEDGRMNITAIGTQRFRVRELHHHHSYLTGTVEQFPFVNGSTRQAEALTHRIRPRLLEYVDLLSQASRQKLKLDRLPEDPTTIAFLVAIAMQVGHEDKQAILERTGIPEILARELHLLSRETLLLQHMIDTHADVVAMSMGPTGCILPN
jgi:Lon protease-like protein